MLILCYCYDIISIVYVEYNIKLLFFVRTHCPVIWSRASFRRIWYQYIVNGQVWSLTAKVMNDSLCNITTEWVERLCLISSFYSYGLALIPAWISNYNQYNVWNEIILPVLNPRCSHWSLGKDMLFHLTLYCACNYFSMLELKLIHLKKSAPIQIVWC